MSKAKVAYAASVLKKIEGKPLLNGEVQPQNYKTGSVYVFGQDNARCVVDDDGTHEDTVFEMGEIRARGAKNGQEGKEKSEIQKINIIHRPVFPNDTLSKFALQYGCTVAELKTVNNFYNEQDFHALKHIKIPIQPHSLLTERAEEERRRENAFANHATGSRSRETSSRGDHSDSDYEDIDNLASPNIRTVSISANLKDHEKFLKRMDDDIQKICQTVTNRESDPNDINRKLSTQCIHPRQTKKKDAEELGSIWTGLGWKSAVAVFVFIAIIVPTVYFIYVEEFKS
ncbi:lysM and putative peptidoglycan-binding domain-containing protein 3-like [Dendronephthya gigantea]|uniref:lysM and putative peptidoglycan-binding domain-containing protein 3-like n=1 Tax=Dendronephthya gigantea TaxID=151771 RepID=UPI00106C6416|nr:lysM and putative peptidoglycan-binding domain-containing protein 3-like [Dendronephthya gigantea]